ncbi:toxin VasX [Ralstonia pseudosolanacearum]|uniref:toxin VasX n=1 Tax=Ralstonia pseudosolanacearum TaxID=1310165 RepID=UPI00399D6492
MPIKTARYGVRMLRAGYLYLRIERRGLLEWEGYAVHPHGYLQQFPVMLPEAARHDRLRARMHDRPTTA